MGDRLRKVANKANKPEFFFKTVLTPILMQSAKNGEFEQSFEYEYIKTDRHRLHIYCRGKVYVTIMGKTWFFNELKKICDTNRVWVGFKTVKTPFSEYGDTGTIIFSW